MGKKFDKNENNKFVLSTVIGVLITWFLILVLIDIIISLHRNSGLETFEGILYFNAILFFLGVCWVIYIATYLLKNIIPVGKGEFSKESTIVKITE